MTTIETTTPETTVRWRTGTARAAIDVALVVVLGAVFLRIAVWPTFVHHYPFGVGPDMPVYLWWSRVGAAQGISLVGERPGAPALIPTVARALGIGLVPAVASVQYALMPACGLAWLSGAVLAIAWTTFLGAGYLANLALAAAFLAAAAALARRTRRGTLAAALLLGGGGLAHPEFFVVAATVLIVSAGWSWTRSRRRRRDAAPDRDDACRVLAALGGGAGLVAGGILAALIGPARLTGDTSLDAMLRRTGQWAELRRVFLDRLVDNWRRYAPFMTTALAIAGSDRSHGFVRRFLVSWALVTAVALPIGVITGWFPPDRLLTFAFCLPILAGFGLVWIGDRIGRPRFAWPVAVVLVTLIVLPAMRDWRAQQTYVSPDELTDVTDAGRIAARTTPAGTPLVFVVDDETNVDNALFLLSNGLNVARAALPPERAADVFTYLGTATNLLADRPTVSGDPVYDRASADSLERLPDEQPAVFVVRELDRDPDAVSTSGLPQWNGVVATNVPIPAGSLLQADGELVASDPSTIAHATLRTFLLFLLLGAGWAGWAFADRSRDAAAALAVAPAFGSAILTVIALGLERVGADLDRGRTATLACAVAGGVGYALLVARLAGEHRRRRTGNLVLEEPAEPDP